MNYYILEGTTAVAVDLMTWTKWLSVNRDSRIVKQTRQGEVYLSTVFLSLDHSFGDGPPLLFETMVFGGEFDGVMIRYSTWDEAARGHAEMAKKVFPRWWHTKR